MRVGVELAGGAVHCEDLDLHVDDLFLLQGEEDTRKDAVFCPAVDPLVNAVPIAVTGGQGSPFASVFNGIEKPLQKREVGDYHIPTLFRKVRSNALKLFRCKSHGEYYITICN